MTKKRKKHYNMYVGDRFMGYITAKTKKDALKKAKKIISSMVSVEFRFDK